MKSIEGIIEHCALAVPTDSFATAGLCQHAVHVPVLLIKALLEVCYEEHVPGLKHVHVAAPILLQSQSSQWSHVILDGIAPSDSSRAHEQYVTAWYLRVTQQGSSSQVSLRKG